MEKVNEILNEIKNRISNPFLFSFLIAWLVTNWKITVGLFVDIWVLQKDGYISYIDLIEKNKSWSNYFWYPIGFALLYVLLIPILKMGISNWNTYFEKLTGDKNLKILDSSKVPFNKYIDLVNQYKAKQQQIEELIRDEKEIYSINRRLIDEKQRLEVQLNESRRDHQQDINSIQNIKVLNGHWNFSRDNIKERFEVVIEDDNAKFYMPYKNEMLEPLEIIAEYYITDFYYNKLNGSLIFCLWPKNKDNDNLVHSLKFNGGEKGFLEGYENFDVRVKYIRKEPY